MGPSLNYARYLCSESLLVYTPIIILHTFATSPQQPTSSTHFIFFCFCFCVFFFLIYLFWERMKERVERGRVGRENTKQSLCWEGRAPPTAPTHKHRDQDVSVNQESGAYQSEPPRFPYSFLYHELIKQE